MLRKALWSLIPLLMVVFLLLISCSPAATSLPAATAPAPTTQAPTTAATSAPTQPPITSWLPPPPKASTEKPKYGGTIKYLAATDPPNFTLGFTNGFVQDFTGFVFQEIFTVDRTKGPAGTGETSYGDFFKGYGATRWNDVVGNLAESFEIPSFGVWVLNIRQGVHYALDPTSAESRLVNGREMTADDIIFDLNYMTKPATDHVAATYMFDPGMCANMTVEKTGPWQITVRTPVQAGDAYPWLFGGTTASNVFPPEITTTADWKTNFWKATIGTGPYMLTDYVPASSLTLTRNSNYWQKNPIGPGKGDSLPYPDETRVLTVPDASTRYAAMRTGAADWIEEVQTEDAQSLDKTTPNLQFKRYQPYTAVIAMTTEKASEPFHDVRVRQALQLGIDLNSIKANYYQGNADTYCFPISQAVGTEKLFTPLNQLPDTARALFTYNPDKAKQLLKDAGYPNGFKSTLIVPSSGFSLQDQDLMSALKDMWSKIGVDINIQITDRAVASALTTARSFDMRLTNVADLNVFSHRYQMSAFRPPNSASGVDTPAGSDPTIEAAFQELQKYVTVDWDKSDKILHDLAPYLVQQVYYIVPPSPSTFRAWQPWIKNYYGESGPRWYAPFPWVDQDLKQTMTGRR